MGTKKPVERLIMSKRAVEFLEEWVSENMVKPVAGAPEAQRFRSVPSRLIAAKEEGIAKEDIEEEVGDAPMASRRNVDEQEDRSGPHQAQEFRAILCVRGWWSSPAVGWLDASVSMSMLPTDVSR
jgi:hypothetical protein